MHVHHGRVFRRPNSRVPLSAGRDSPGRGKGKAARIDAGRGHSPSWPVPSPTWRRGRSGLRTSVAGAGPPAASGLRAGRAARSLAGDDLICFSSTHRSCMVEVSPSLSSSKSGVSTCCLASRRPIWSGMRSAPGKPGQGFIARREHSSAAAAGRGSLRAVLVSFT